MNEDEWAGKVHLRTAPKCCALCRYYDPDYECGGDCKHPEAVLGTEDGNMYRPGVSEHNVCDKFERQKQKEKS